MTIKSGLLRKIDNEIEKISDRELLDVGGGLDNKIKIKNTQNATLVQTTEDNKLNSQKEFVNC